MLMLFDSGIWSKDTIFEDFTDWVQFPGFTITQNIVENVNHMAHFKVEVTDSVSFDVMRHHIPFNWKIMLKLKN